MLLPALLSYMGFTALCLSMPRHYGELLSGTISPARARLVKLAGWMLLTLSMWASVAADGWGFGLVQGVAVLMASVMLLVFLMPFRPGWVLKLATLSAVLVPIVAGVSG